jgi:tetratricopeptide (TPR) repeat protein
LRVEPVAWASARKDVLSAFFFLCALIVYVDFVRAESGGSRRAYYILTLFLSLLALLSKPTAMTLPFVLFVLDFYPLSRLERGTLGRLTLEKAPFLLLAAGAMAMNFFAARDVAVTLDYVPASVRIMNSFYAIIFYISRSIFPANLIPLYMMNRDLDYFGPVYVTSAVLVMAATVICIWRAMKNDRLWAAVWFYYLITLAPTLGFFMSFRHYVADRYSYLPTMAWWVLAGLAAARLWEAAGKVRHGPAFRAGLKVLWAGCFVLLAFLYGYCTESQIRVWKNTETLWQYVIDKADYIPDLAYAALGDDLERKGELDKALSHFQKAFSLNPRNNIFRGKVADILAKQGQKEEALAIHEAIRDVEPKNPWAHANVGRMLAMMGRHDEAIEALKKALELQPDYGNALLMLSAVYLETKDRTQALYYYNKYVSEGFPRRPGLERELGILPGSADKDR